MLKRLDASWFDAIYAIMEEAFPQSERRIKEEQRSLLSLSEYEVYGWVENDALLAFLAAWDLDNILPPARISVIVKSDKNCFELLKR